MIKYPMSTMGQLLLTNYGLIAFLKVFDCTKVYLVPKTICLMLWDNPSMN